MVKDGIHLLDPDGIYLNQFITDMTREARLQIGAIAGFIKTQEYPTPIRTVIRPMTLNEVSKDANLENTAALQREADKKL